MSKDIDQKRMLIAKCYELAILEHGTKFVNEWVSSEVDDLAMSYLDKVIFATKVLQRKEYEDSDDSTKSYDRNR